MLLATFIKGVPSLIAGGAMAWHVRKQGAGVAIQASSGVGAAFATYCVADFLFRRFSSQEPMPGKQQMALEHNVDPQSLPTAEEVLGAVAAKAEAVKDQPNPRPTTLDEVGSNVIDIKKDNSSPNTGDSFGSAFGSV